MTSVRAILAILLLTAGPAVSIQHARKAAFDTRYIVAYGRRVETQFYDFTGDGLRDALVVSIDFDADPPARWLALHKGAKGGLIAEKPDQIWSAGPETSVLALGNVVPEGGMDILEIAVDGVYYHAFEKDVMVEEPRKLIHTRTFFSSPSFRSLPMWSGPVDLNNDKLDDLIIPVPEGYKVYFQTKPGQFGNVQRLEADVAPGGSLSLAPQRFAGDWERLVARGLPATAGTFNLYNDVPRITAVDLNDDDLKELVSLNGSLMTVFFQKPAQRFPAKERRLHNVQTLKDERKKDAVNVPDVQFADIDGDKLMDLVVTKIEGELGLLDSIKTRIYPHLGTGRETFRPDVVIFIDGISLNPTFIDMDGDGALDVLTSRLRTDIISKGLERAFLGDITVTYEVFQFDKKARAYSTKPVYNYDVYVKDDDITKRGAASRPLFQVPGDLTGDKRPDAVLFNPKTSMLEVRKGRTKWAPGNIAEIDFEMDAAATYEIDKNNFPKWISYMDMDNDGRQDILLNYASQLIILMSRF